jgi:hypothetical protein
VNLYIDLAFAKTAMGITTTANDAILLANIEAASRLIDSMTGRHFYTVNATRYFDTQWCDTTLIDDVLSISSVGMDSDADATYDGTMLVEGTDFYLWPDNNWPKLQMHILQGSVNHFAHSRRRWLKITGVWGYGDGLSSNPWTTTAVTGTVGTTSGTALTLSVSAGVAAGQTIKLADEQMYVSAVTTTTATVVRGVNGTTPITHAAATISTAKYPAVAKQAVQYLSALWMNEAKSPGVRMQMIGEYQEQRGGAMESDRFLMRMLGGITR